MLVGLMAEARENPLKPSLVFYLGRIVASVACLVILAVVVWPVMVVAAAFLYGAAFHLLTIIVTFFSLFLSN